MSDAMLRQQLVELLEGGHAHVEPARALGGVPPSAWGERAPGAPHTLWQLLEHMRICQWDILEFSRSREHVSPPYPEGYWPAAEAPPDEATVTESLSAFHRDLEQMTALVQDETTDLSARIAWGQGQTILREAMLVADHNAYHLGQFVLIRKLLGAWP